MSLCQSKNTPLHAPLPWNEENKQVAELSHTAQFTA